MDATQENKIVAEFKRQRQLKFTTGQHISDLEIINSLSEAENVNKEEILKVLETAGHESNRPDLKYKKSGNDPGNNYFC